MNQQNEFSNPVVRKIFDDLDQYRDFCRSFGYPFNERDLYSQRSFIFRQYEKHKVGKPFKDNWAAHLRPRQKKHSRSVN